MPLAELYSDLARSCLSYYRQQRILTHPVLVHCVEGSGRSAAFVLMAAAMSEVDLANFNSSGQSAVGVDQTDGVMPDLVKMGALMCQQRKGILRDRMHLRQAYEGTTSVQKKNPITSLRIYGVILFVF